MFKISDDKIECADQHQDPRSRCQHQEIRILKADALVKDLRLLREDLLKGCVNSDAKRLVDESMSWPNTQDRTKLFRRTENAGEPRF